MLATGSVCKKKHQLINSVVKKLILHTDPKKPIKYKRETKKIKKCLFKANRPSARRHIGYAGCKHYGKPRTSIHEEPAAKLKEEPPRLGGDRGGSLLLLFNVFSLYLICIKKPYFLNSNFQEKKVKFTKVN